MLAFEHAPEDENHLQASVMKTDDERAVAAGFSHCNATLAPGQNCQGDDLGDGGVVGSTDECCGLCASHGDCRAFTWNQGGDRHCWLKRDCLGKRPDSQAVSGHTTVPHAVCQQLPDTNCNQNDLADGGKVTSAGACCDICAATTGCAAWTWNRAEGNRHCWLKRNCDGKRDDLNADSGLVRSPKPPIPPAPPLPPSPPASKGIQVGVSLGGWLLMETAWMYDQFKMMDL